MNKVLFVIILSLYASFYKCSRNLSGTETETQTGFIYCKVFDGLSDSTASNKPVFLHSLNDSLPRQISSYTDSQGFFSIDSVEIGTYFLEIGDSLMSALVPCTVVTDETWIDTVYTLPTGFIKGNLCVPFLGTIFYVNVYINEINRSFRIDSTGIFTFSYLPAFSEYTFNLAYKTVKSTFPFQLDSIDVNAGDTTNIGNIALFHGNARIFGSFPRDTFNVHHAKLTITAYNLLPITSDLTITDTTLYGVVEGIPEGLDRIFEARVLDSNDVILFSGKDTTDIEADSTDTLFINLDYHTR